MSGLLGMPNGLLEGRVYTFMIPINTLENWLVKASGQIIER
jgi:hypothetical protein